MLVRQMSNSLLWKEMREGTNNSEIERMNVCVHIWAYSLAAGIKLRQKSTSPPLCCYRKKRIWWKSIQNIWIKFMACILTGKPAFLILQKCVCLLYAAASSGELLEASENWAVSPSQITCCFVMVSRLWLAISSLHGQHFWRTCATPVRQPGIVLVECQGRGTSKSDLGFLPRYYLGGRDMSRMEKVLTENNPHISKVLLAAEF